jgi:hypothetical protein
MTMSPLSTPEDFCRSALGLVAATESGVTCIADFRQQLAWTNERARLQPALHQVEILFIAPNNTSGNVGAHSLPSRTLLPM